MNGVCHFYIEIKHSALQQTIHNKYVASPLDLEWGCPFSSFEARQALLLNLKLDATTIIKDENVIICNRFILLVY